METDQKLETSVTPARKQLPLWVMITAFAILIGFLALIGWGLRQSQSGPIVIGQKVQSFTVTTFDGQTYNTAALGGKVIVLNFWASWCDPCKQEAAVLEQVWQKNKNNNVVFIGADYVDTEPEARAYLAQFKVTYPNGPDLRTVVSQMFRIRGVPETYIIGKDGRLKYSKIGPFVSLDELQSALDAAMKE